MLHAYDTNVVSVLNLSVSIDSVSFFFSYCYALLNLCITNKRCNSSVQQNMSSPYVASLTTTAAPVLYVLLKLFHFLRPGRSSKFLEACILTDMTSNSGVWSGLCVYSMAVMLLYSPTNADDRTAQRNCFIAFDHDMTAEFKLYAYAPVCSHSP